MSRSPPCKNSGGQELPAEGTAHAKVLGAKCTEVAGNWGNKRGDVREVSKAEQIEGLSV